MRLFYMNTIINIKDDEIDKARLKIDIPQGNSCEYLNGFSESHDRSYETNQNKEIHDKCQHKILNNEQCDNIGNVCMDINVDRDNDNFEPATKLDGSNVKLSIDVKLNADTIKQFGEIKICDKEVDFLDRELENDWNKELQKRARRTMVYDPRIKQKRMKFSEKMFQKYDIPAREKLLEVFGDFIIENPNPYKQDFIITSKTCKYKYLEVQVLSSWVNYEYTQDTVWVYARKSVYANDTLFITLNKKLKYGFIFDAKSFKDVKPRRMKKYSRHWVYDIPWHRIMKVSLEHIDKETIELY
jgi:hypothetical protein